MSTSTPFVTPVVARVAAELGVDLTGVTGTGVGGRITVTDVRTTAAARTDQSAPTAGTGTPTGPAADGGWFPGVGTPDIPA